MQYLLSKSITDVDCDRKDEEDVVGCGEARATILLGVGNGLDALRSLRIFFIGAAIKIGFI